MNTRDVSRNNCIFFAALQNAGGYGTTDDPTTNECYSEQFLSIKSGSYNERGMLVYVFYAFIMESSIIVFAKKRLFMVYM
jgi:hypothetical protein